MQQPAWSMHTSGVSAVIEGHQGHCIITHTGGRGRESLTIRNDFKDAFQSTTDWILLNLFEK